MIEYFLYEINNSQKFLFNRDPGSQQLCEQYFAMYLKKIKPRNFEKPEIQDREKEDDFHKREFKPKIQKKIQSLVLQMIFCGFLKCILFSLLLWKMFFKINL